jgi:uncharacterized RDD family membrane protein YckC
MDAPPANPYEAPRTAELSADAEAEEIANLAPASLGLRFANLIIDYVMVIVAMFLVGFVAYFVSPTRDIRDMSTPISLGVMIAYYIGLEAIAGRTVGKLITGTRVVRFDGHRPHFPQIIGRTAARFIPFEPFSFLGGSGYGWHDSLSGTRVVRVRR